MDDCTEEQVSSNLRGFAVGYGSCHGGAEQSLQRHMAVVELSQDHGVGRERRSGSSVLVLVGRGRAEADLGFVSAR